MAYFDPVADAIYLHASVREHAELEAVAQMAEEDVLAKTGRAAHGEEGAAKSGEAQALKRTIADVVSHRLRYYDREADLASESRGSRSQSYRDRRFDPEWPEDWRWRLREYDGVVYYA